MSETKTQVFIPSDPGVKIVIWPQGLSDAEALQALVERKGEILPCSMTFCAFWGNRPCTVPFRNEEDARGWLECMAHFEGNNAVTEPTQQTGYSTFNREVLLAFRKLRRSGPVLIMHGDWRTSFDGYESPRFHAREDAEEWLKSCADFGKWVPAYAKRNP